MRVKSSGLANAWPSAPGQLKICKCATPGTDKAGKCPAVARSSPGDALNSLYKKTVLRNRVCSIATCVFRSETKRCTVDSLNGHLYKTDTSLKRTPRVGPCLSLLPLFLPFLVWSRNPPPHKWVGVLRDDTSFDSFSTYPSPVHATLSRAST